MTHFPPKYPHVVYSQAARELASIGALDLLESKDQIKTPLELALDSVITQDPETIKTKDIAKRLSPHSLPVLILGETGTGKELFARILHGNRKGSFIAVNCGGIPDTLIESEFFGCVKGSFTGATARPGYFEQASEGTIFLDEIGELERSLQSKLLRVIQEKRVRRIGDSIERPLSCRIVSATNYPVETLKTNNKFFRSDLFYRLAGTVIHLKPLRQRGDDAYLIADVVSKTNGFKIPSSEWKGNIRELLNYIEESKILSSLLPDKHPPDAQKSYEPVGTGVA